MKQDKGVGADSKNDFMAFKKQKMEAIAYSLCSV